jgi:hypothetical protein
MQRRVFSLFSALFLLAATASAGLPRPMVVYYGQACDAFGQVYKSGADVILLRGTQEVARCTIAGAIGPGVNFALRVPYDGGGEGGNYVEWAVNAGDELDVWVGDARGLRKVDGCTVPPVGAPGETIALRLVAGEDADGDGMPDAWERANGLDPADPADAAGDMDGDGAANLAEFRAGTVPWLAEDVFGVELFETTPSGMFRLSFPSAYGKVYRIQAAPLALDGTGNFAWAACPFALEDGEEPSQTLVQGTGEPVTVYLDASALSGVWRIETE